MNHRRVALVTCEAFPQLYEDDVLLAVALQDIGITGVPCVWSDAQVAWGSFDAVVVRSPWDYFERTGEFRTWLDARISSGGVLCNSADILDWNYDKKYLADLARAGVPLVPTIWIERGDTGADIAGQARARGWDDIVVKPTISGGAYRTYRFPVAELERHRAEIAHTLLDRGVLVQPFLPEILTGELSLLFFDGVFSHAVCKRPREGDYRVQFQFGGTSTSVAVSDTRIAEAERCVAAAPSLPVYARVDGVVKDGQFLVMELEAFEPLMFLSCDAAAPVRFARAIARRLPANGEL
jgi:glutathione synthase/RimK-type ligase-like ATP-grasp enzyme